MAEDRYSLVSVKGRQQERIPDRSDRIKTIQGKRSYGTHFVDWSEAPAAAMVKDPSDFARRRDSKLAK